jgi:hypothetical protein
MKRLLLSLLAALLISIGSYAQCFTPVGSRYNFGSMSIYVSLASLNGSPLQAGDEIGVFDGELCVGTGILTEELGEDSAYLEIETPIQYHRWGGFTPGDTIAYRFCIGGQVTNSIVVPTYLSNGPTFEVNASCIVELHAVNSPPYLMSAPDTVATEDQPYSSSIVVEDIDGDSLIYSAPLLPSWLSFDTITHTLSGVPENSHVGEHHVVLIVSDGIVDMIHTFVITVENVNDPPVVLSIPVTEARPGVAYTYTISAEDIDGDLLEYTALVLPGWLSFNTSTHTLSATPSEEDIGDQHVTIRISDGTLYTDHTFIITVEDVNHAPTFISDPVTSISVGDTYEYTILAEDIDKDTLSYMVPQLPPWLGFHAEALLLSGVPDNGDKGNHEVTVRVYDGTTTSEQHFTIVVRDANSPPSFVSTPVTNISAGEFYVYTAEAMDADNDALSFSASKLPGWLTFDVNSRNLYGIPTNDDAGDHQVSLQVTDGYLSDDQIFVISVDFVYAIEGLSAKEAVLIYPNPTHGSFFVKIPRTLDREVCLELRDPTGRVLIHEKFPPHFRIQGEYHLRNPAPGIYLIRIFDETKQSTWKLILL